VDTLYRSIFNTHIHRYTRARGPRGPRLPPRRLWAESRGGKTPPRANIFELATPIPMLERRAHYHPARGTPYLRCATIGAQAPPSQGVRAHATRWKPPLAGLLDWKLCDCLCMYITTTERFVLAPCVCINCAFAFVFCVVLTRCRC